MLWQNVASAPRPVKEYATRPFPSLPFGLLHSSCAQPSTPYPHLRPSLPSQEDGNSSHMAGLMRGGGGNGAGGAGRRLCKGLRREYHRRANDDVAAAGKEDSMADEKVTVGFLSPMGSTGSHFESFSRFVPQTSPSKWGAWT